MHSRNRQLPRYLGREQDGTRWERRTFCGFDTEPETETRLSCIERTAAVMDDMSNGVRAVICSRFRGVLRHFGSQIEESLAFKFVFRV